MTTVRFSVLEHFRRQFRAIRVPVALVVVSVVIGLAAIGRGHTGADFLRYLEWSKAFLTSDLAQMSYPVVSPKGYPLIQLFPGSGALFALPKLVASGISLRVSAYLATGAAALVLWTCAAVLVWRAARGRTDLMLVGLPLLFIATHAGYQSTTASSEVLSLALMAVMLVSLTADTDEPSPFAILVFGCAAGLMVTVRANYVPYVAAAGSVQVRRILMATSPRSLKACLLLLATVPVAAGCAEVLMANYWMTGSWTQSPYLPGDDQFHSLDLSHPHVLRVLFHPWHGLLAYHPWYAMLIVTTVAGLRTRSVGRDERVAWGFFLVAAAVTLLLQASWYAWWMGLNTFGGRAFAPWAILFAPMAIRYVASMEPGSGALRVFWTLGGVMAAWSYALLLGGATNFLSGRELLSGLWTAVRSTFGSTYWHGAALGAGALVHWLANARQPARDAGVSLLWSLIVVYLFHDSRLLRGESGGGGLGVAPALELVTVALVPLGVRQVELARATLATLGRRALRASQVATVCAFCLTGGLFVRLSLNTSSIPAAAVECFQYRAPFDVQEVLATLAEYERLPGFEDDKRRLRSFALRVAGRYRTQRGDPGMSQERCLAQHGVAVRPI